MSKLQLTTAQLAEIQARPVPCTNMTPEQFSMRVEIARRGDALVAEDAHKKAPELEFLYAKYPPSKFYTNPERTAIRRIYGFCQTKTDYRAHVVSALTAMNNIPIDGVPVDELVPLDQWDTDHLERLKSGLIINAGLFLDPLGYLMMAGQNE
jgi:hypothetical protein